MFGKKAKIFIFSYLLLINYNFCSAQFINGFRVGGGIGVSYYLGTQTDNSISFNTFGKSEVNRGINGQIYYAINNRHEIGLRALNTELWSFKSQNYLALNAKINDVFLVYQYSLNNNVKLKNRFGKNYTLNAVAGLGVIYFKSIFYTSDPRIGQLTNFSSVGNGLIYTSSGLVIPEQQPAISGMVGFNVGYRLTNFLTIYAENSITLSGSNKITGNLLTKYLIPNNGYYYGSLSLFINFNSKINPLSCPKF